MTLKGKKIELGVLKIKNDVIGSIARNAALQVDGVEGIKTSLLATIVDFFNPGYHKNGISLEINENEVTIGVTIIVRYGKNIPEIAALVQENIRTAVEDMTGLLVTVVNINIGDIHSKNAET
ncbi:MAG: Asp23/Gls24 family envelope stress response protein [Candidatus Omnitrophica bacterium]|nr:Asp23/Gls24 family envelope stress response protein [Candidatus Omnitrophota bacterium]